MEEEVYVSLIKCVTEFILDRTQTQSETLKIITVGVQSAIRSHKVKEKISRKKPRANCNLDL